MLNKILKGLARMFTVPRAVREQVKANPIAAEAKALAAVELAQVIPQTLALHIDNPQAVAALSEAIGHAIDATGALR